MIFCPEITPRTSGLRFRRREGVPAELLSDRCPGNRQHPAEVALHEYAQGIAPIRAGGAREAVPIPPFQPKH